MTCLYCKASTVFSDTDEQKPSDLMMNALSIIELDLPKNIREFFYEGIEQLEKWEACHHGNPIPENPEYVHPCPQCARETEEDAIYDSRI